MNSGVLCHSSSVLMRTRGALESRSRQQLDRCLALFKQQDITVICTIHFHLWLHNNHTIASAPETPTETDTQHVYQKTVRDVNELKQHVIDTWSATSRASLIKRLISGKIVLMRVSKPKANTEHLKGTNKKWTKSQK